MPAARTARNVMTLLVLFDPHWSLLNLRVVPFNLLAAVIEIFTLSFLGLNHPSTKAFIAMYPQRGQAMPRALKDFGEAEAFHNSSHGPQRDIQDRVLLGVLTTGAALAIAVFAFVALSFFSH